MSISPVVQPRPPARTLAQRFDALRRANVVRHYRAELKRELHTGARRVEPLLLEPPDAQLATMRVVDLLAAVPGLGDVKVARMLRQARVSPSRTLDSLTVRQRRDLVARLPRRRA